MSINVCGDAGQHTPNTSHMTIIIMSNLHRQGTRNGTHMAQQQQQQHTRKT